MEDLVRRGRGGGGVGGGDIQNLAKNREKKSEIKWAGFPSSSHLIFRIVS